MHSQLQHIRNEFPVITIIPVRVHTSSGKHRKWKHAHKPWTSLKILAWSPVCFFRSQRWVCWPWCPWWPFDCKRRWHPGAWCLLFWDRVRGRYKVYSLPPHSQDPVRRLYHLGEIELNEFEYPLQRVFLYLSWLIIYNPDSIYHVMYRSSTNTTIRPGQVHAVHGKRQPLFVE